MLYNALDNISFHSVRQFSSCLVLPILSLFGKHMSLSRAVVASGCQVPLNLSTDGARVYSYELWAKSYFEVLGVKATHKKTN